VLTQVAVRINGVLLKKVFYIDMNLQRGSLVSGFSSLVQISKTVYMKIPSEITNALIDNGIDLQNEKDFYDAIALLNHPDTPDQKSFEIIMRFTPKITNIYENRNKGEK